MKIGILIIQFVFPIGSNWLPFGIDLKIRNSTANLPQIYYKSDIRFVADLDYFD